MRTPPDDLDASHLALLVADSWRYPVAQLSYAPVGFGSHHWVATHANGERRFVTVDDLREQGLGDADAGLHKLRRALSTAHALHEDAGLSFVVAPLAATDGTVLRVVGTSYAVSVFPFVDSKQAIHLDSSTVVETLARLHGATEAVRQLVGVDDLQLCGRADLENALHQLDEPWTSGPYAEGTRHVLASSAAGLRLALRQYDELGERARTSTVPWVVTHGEPKSDNFIAAVSGAKLVDWDTVLLAPAARDVWMVEGEFAATAYTELTGRGVAQDELAFMRLRWDLADVAAYVRWFREPHGQNADSEIGWNALTETLQRIRIGRSSGAASPTTS